MTYLKPVDIDAIYDALDPTFSGSIEIYSVD